MKYADALRQANELVELLSRSKTQAGRYPGWRENFDAVHEVAERLMAEDKSADPITIEILKKEIGHADALWCEGQGGIAPISPGRVDFIAQLLAAMVATHQDIEAQASAAPFKVASE